MRSACDSSRVTAAEPDASGPPDPRSSVTMRPCPTVTDAPAAQAPASTIGCRLHDCCEHTHGRQARSRSVLWPSASTPCVSRGAHGVAARAWIADARARSRANRTRRSWVDISCAKAGGRPVRRAALREPAADDPSGQARRPRRPARCDQAKAGGRCSRCDPAEAAPAGTAMATPRTMATPHDHRNMATPHDHRPMTTDAAIETTALAKRYGSTTALAGLTMHVPAGHVFGFLGPNGAGKTTAVKLLLGLARPTAGGGTVLGRPLGDRAARARIGYLPELFRYQAWLTARDVLGLHASLAGLPHGDRRAAIGDALAMVGLADRGDDRVGTFSKGMQQRLGLGVALLGRPDLVFLDEPTSALDPIGRQDVRAVIRALRDRGTAVFLNSHLLTEVERVCDAVAIVDHGTVVAAGTLDELLRSRHGPAPCHRARRGRAGTGRDVRDRCRTTHRGSSSTAARPSGSPTSWRRSSRPADGSMRWTRVARRSRTGSSSSSATARTRMEVRPRDRPRQCPRHRPADPARGAAPADPAGPHRPDGDHRRPDGVGLRRPRRQCPATTGAGARDPRRDEPAAHPRRVHVQLRPRDDRGLPRLGGDLRGSRFGCPAHDRRPADPAGRDPRRQMARSRRHRRRVRRGRRPARDPGRGR